MHNPICPGQERDQQHKIFGGNPVHVINDTEGRPWTAHGYDQDTRWNSQ